MKHVKYLGCIRPPVGSQPRGVRFCARCWEYKKNKTDQGLEPCPHKALRLPRRGEKQITKHYRRKEPQGKRNISQFSLLGKRKYIS